MPLRCFALAAGTLTIASAASAQMPDEHPAQAELVLERDHVRVGDTFGVGVRIRMKPGWHVYWSYPGDSGLSTQVQVKLPDAAVGEVRFPTPHEFVQPGDIAGYGYEGEVMLEVPVTATGAAGVRDLKAEISWLVCEKVCLPGSASLSAAVEIGTERGPVRVDFSRWRAQVPREASDAHVRVRTNGTLADGRIRVRLRWPESAPPEVEWFPVLGEALEVENVRLESKRRRTQITFDARVLEGQAYRGPLRAVIAYGKGEHRRGVWITIPLGPAR